MWHEELLVKVITRDPIWEDQPALSEVVLRFVRVLCPAIIQHYAGKAALGGAGQLLTEEERAVLPEGARPLTEEEYARFGKKADQSLAAHLINGAFAGYRLGALLPDDFNWNERQWTLWTLGFVLHDYTKMRGVNVFASRLDAARALCREVGAELRFAEFFPEWESYLDDIVFLAQNTQKVQGANLNERDYALLLPTRQRDPLRMLASFADVLVHITEPRDVAAPSAEDGRPTHFNLRDTLRALLTRERAPRLAYHQMAETRGLLTNLLHNATREVFRQQGFQPYLYFADGVVYLAPQEDRAQVTVEQVVERTWQEITGALTKSESFGLARDGKGLKIASALYQFLTPAELIEAGATFALGIKNGVTGSRLAKYGAADPNLAADLRADWLGEYLAYLKRIIAEVLLPTAKDLSAFLLTYLKLNGVVSVAEAERNEGGVPLGWYYAAAHFLTLHPTLTPQDMEGVLRQIGQAFLAELQRQGLPAQGASTLKDALTSYVRQVLDCDGVALTGEQAPAQFSEELTRYLGNKASNRPVCSLCSSPYENEEQTVTVVLFKPQQYSNKNKLGGSRVVRGVCPICSLEMLLRQAQQGAPAGKLQDEKAIYLTLYPVYFFTPEIAALLQDYERRLEDLRLYLGADSLLGWLRKEGEDGALQLEHLARYARFLSDEDDEALTQKRRRTIRLPPGYSDTTLHGLALLPLIPNMMGGTDTEAWVLPAFYALALPLLLNVKVVASASFVPLYTSGAAFRETAILDSMHPAVQQALGKDSLRVDELLPALKRLLSFYDLHTEVYAEGFDAHCGQLGAVVRDVHTDAYHVFAYYDRKRRGGGDEKKGAKGKKAAAGGGEPAREGIPRWEQHKYLDIYYTLGGEQDMGIVGKLVDGYAAFYRAERDKLDSAYSVVKPLSIATETTLNSPPELAEDDLVEVIAGEIFGLMERIRDKQAAGFAVYASPEAGRDRIREFASIFVYELFFKLCDGKQSSLREQSNRLRAAALFCYLSRYARGKGGGANAAPGSNE
jgi:CRISPR-associated protein Csc3